MIEKKFLRFDFDIKHVGAEGIVEGYASTFGNIDLGGDVVDPGAFKKTLRENKGKVPILADHNPYQQIGWNLEGVEDDKGLKVSGKFDIANNAKALEKFSLIKMASEIGAKSGLSIGYYTIKAEPDKENPTVRRLKELKLLEYSPVVFPMNEQATANRAKSAMQDVFALLNIDDAVSLDHALKIFIESAKQRGHTEQEIKSALDAVRAATNPKADPVPRDQSFLEKAKQLTELFRKG